MHAMCHTYYTWQLSTVVTLSKVLSTVGTLWDLQLRKVLIHRHVLSLVDSRANAL